MIMSDLPEDLVEEILCRVPATSLNKLRSTCKLWNRKVKYDRRFARKHSDKASKQFLALRLAKNYRVCPISVNLHGIDPSVEVKSELSLVDPRYKCQFDISRVLHCDGLLLCNPIYKHRVVVWNPLTGQTKWIDAGDRFGHAFVLGYSQDSRSCSKSYKILSVSLDGIYSEIYDLGSDSWRSLGFDRAPYGSRFGFSSHKSVSLKGNTYWFGRDVTKITSLFMFDFSTEKFASFPLPYQYKSYGTMNLSAVREEKLSVLLQRDYTSKTEIWVTTKIDESTNVVSWTKVLALDLSHDLQISEYGSFLLDEEKKLVVWSEKWLDDDEKCKSKDMIYIVGEDNKVTQVDTEIDTWGYCFPAILTYVVYFTDFSPCLCTAS